MNDELVIQIRVCLSSKEVQITKVGPSEEELEAAIADALRDPGPIGLLISTLDRDALLAPCPYTSPGFADRVRARLAERAGVNG